MEYIQILRGRKGPFCILRRSKYNVGMLLGASTFPVGGYICLVFFFLCDYLIVQDRVDFRITGRSDTAIHIFTLMVTEVVYLVCIGLIYEHYI